MKEDKYKVHIAGPDDIVFFGDELEALRYANDTNKIYIKDRLEHPGDEVLMVATVDVLVRQPNETAEEFIDRCGADNGD